MAHCMALLGLPGGSDSEESACYAGDLGSIPGWGSSLEKRWPIHSVFLPGKSVRWKELAG